MKEEEKNNNSEPTMIFIRLTDPKDGYAELSVSPDKMTVIANIFPPKQGGQFLNFQNILAKLDEAGINYGINHDVIKDAVFEANSTNKEMKNLLIAKGIKAKNEIEEHFLIRKDLIEKRQRTIDGHSINWHEISAFTIVQLKEPLAKRILKTDGEAGINVYSEEVQPQVETKTNYSAGMNIIEHRTGLFAGKSGRLSINEQGEISVEDVLVLKKGIDFTTGNISFPGDVILEGKIADGFKVYAGGSLISSEVVDATEIVCKKDLIVQAGIEGGGKGSVRVGGSVTSKYIQNCRIAVRGNVNVSGSIVQSKVYSMSSIIMGDSGKIVGCDCITIGNVISFDIGNARGTKTYIRCGTDFTVQQELDIANEQLKILTLKLKQAEEVVKIEPLPDIVNFIEEANAKKIEISNKIANFLPKIDTNEEAYVEAKGTIFPGTEIEICHVSFTVTEPLKQQILKLDKVRGVIVSEPIKK